MADGSLRTPKSDNLRLGIGSHKKLHTLDNTQANKPFILLMLAAVVLVFQNDTNSRSSQYDSLDMYQAPARM